MDMYRMQNVQADTQMREALAADDGHPNGSVGG
jgi:hypothetical protein